MDYDDIKKELNLDEEENESEQAEIEEVNQNDAQQVQEEQEGNEGQEEKEDVSEVEFYTEDEINQLIESGRIDEIDEGRVPENLRESFKLVKQAYERGKEKAVELKGEEEIKLEPINVDEETLELIQKKDEVFRRADQKIAELVAQLRSDEVDDPEPILKQIEEINQLKTYIIETEQKLANYQQQVAQLYQSTYADIKRFVPDFDNVREELVKYAKDRLGYTDEELDRMTNPVIVGKTNVVKFVKMVYDKYNNERNVKQVRQRKQPPPTSTSSTHTGGASPKEKSYWDMDDAEFETLIERVKMGKNE